MIFDEKRTLKYMSWGFYLLFIPIVLRFIPTDCFLERAPVFFSVLIIYMSIVHVIHRRFNPLKNFLTGAYLKAIGTILITVALTLIAIYVPLSNIRGYSYSPAQLENLIRIKNDALWLFFFIDISFAIMLGLAGELLKQKSRHTEIMAEKNKAEIALYRSQMNPHFMLNSLNTLYGLYLTGNEKTGELFLKFSDMIKYSFTMGECESVEISEEVKYIQEYIDIHKLRLSEKTNVSFACEIDDPSQTIAPMLLISFVENCFKYGVSSSKESAISIELSLKKGLFSFQSRNKIFTRMTSSTGIGLNNTRKRLQLLYPNRFDLKHEVIQQDEYVVSLHITLY